VNVPRPLLIVIVVLLVLAVGGCVVGLGRSGEGAGKLELRNALDSDLIQLLQGLAPAPEPIELTLAEAPCLAGGGTALQFSGECTLTIPERAGRSRLDLRVALGSTMSVVDVKVDGTTVGDPDDPSFPQPVPFLDDGQLQREVAIVLSRGEQAAVVLQCTSAPPSCVVAVNPD
jgi:hypothetical protein